MEELNNQLLEKIKKFVDNILEKQLSENLVFHSRGHTLEVCNNAEIIGKYGNFDENEMNILIASALLHDIGYSVAYKGHEIHSVRIAVEYLQKENARESVISRITSAILATEVPQKPGDRIEEALCDADLMHLSYADYYKYMHLLRKEWELMGISKLDTVEFNRKSVEFFNSHHYHTEYGKKILAPKKEENLKQLIHKLNARE